MKRHNQPVEIIFQQPPATQKARFQTRFDHSKAIQKQLESAGIPIGTVKQSGTTRAVFKSKYKSGSVQNVYAKRKIIDMEVNPWDVLHTTSAALNRKHAFVEPDFLQEFTIHNKITGVPEIILLTLQY